MYILASNGHVIETGLSLLALSVGVLAAGNSAARGTLNRLHFAFRSSCFAMFFFPRSTIWC